MVYGRNKLITYEEYIDETNVIKVLGDVMPAHIENSARIDYLLKYEAGEQPIKREKVYRSDIDCRCIDNVANEITEFKRGFQWSNPITLIRSDDSDESVTSSISALNKQFALDGSRKKTQEIGRFVEVTGICNEYIDINDDWREGKAYFKTVPLNPKTSFVVYSGYYVDRRPMMGVTYRRDKKGNYRFTCITKNQRFEILNMHKIENAKTSDDANRWDPGSKMWAEAKSSGNKNPFGIINIIEWERDSDRMGCFERQIPDMDMLNLLESDFVNDVEQNTQAVWHSNDVAFPDDDEGEKIKPNSGDWIETYTTPDGKQPFIKPLSVTYDYNGMLHNILSKRTLILQKANVPQRNDNSGGSTGIAMSDATGWSSAEMCASKQQPYQEDAKMREIEVILEVIKYSKCPADSELRQLSVADIEPNVKRTKSYEMTSKANALSTLLKAGIYGEHAIKGINFFDDPNETWELSKEMITKIQNSIIKEDVPNNDRIATDESDQIENSPNIDGMRTAREETMDSNEKQ